ncbi:tetraspanin 37 [Cololabis saira]|uniref:tetraspanin 37 n=1 Tax=Cololabis saira TaxID=129043 RepID=UPI002AD207F1|nr:tetraspanin 37 [Cololabis saira]
MCGQRRNAYKTALRLTSQLLWVVGTVVGLSAVYLLMKYRQNSLFFAQTYFALPAFFALCSAAFLLATGFLGFRISLGESRCLQGLFVYMLVVAFCLESTASALAFYHSKKLDSDIAPLSDVFQEYTGSSQDASSRAVDVTQEEFQCCGVRNYTDWMETSWFNRTGELLVPRSCCNTTSFPSCNGTVDQPWQFYPEGCHMKLERTLKFILSFIIWSSLGFFLMEVVLLLMVAKLMRDKDFLEYHIMDYK